jgi:hypothetical protein
MFLRSDRKYILISAVGPHIFFLVTTEEPMTRTDLIRAAAEAHAAEVAAAAIARQAYAAARLLCAESGIYDATLAYAAGDEAARLGAISDALHAALR